MVGSQLSSAPCNFSSVPVELIYIIPHTKLFFFPPCMVSGDSFAWVYTPETNKADKLHTVPLIS